jgi:hypothetical protein
MTFGEYLGEPLASLLRIPCYQGMSLSRQQRFCVRRKLGSR